MTTREPAAHPDPLLRTSLRRLPVGTLLVQLSGEIDLSNAHTVAGLHVEFAGSTAMIIDLSAVTFLGAAGLAALVVLDDRAESSGCALIVIGTAHHPVRSPLAACGLDRFLRVHAAAISGRSTRFY